MQALQVFQEILLNIPLITYLVEISKKPMLYLFPPNDATFYFFFYHRVFIIIGLFLDIFYL
jgi:hypothetical protein